MPLSRRRVESKRGFALTKHLQDLIFCGTKFSLDFFLLFILDEFRKKKTIGFSLGKESIFRYQPVNVHFSDQCGDKFAIRSYFSPRNVFVINDLRDLISVTYFEN